MADQAIDYDALAKQHGAVNSTPPVGPRMTATTPLQRMTEAFNAKQPPPSALETTLRTPLGHPTGVDAIDDLTSPVNLAAVAFAGAKPAAQLAFKAVSGLLGSVAPEVATELVGLLSPRAAHALKLAQKVTAAVEKGSAAAAAAAGPRVQGVSVAELRAAGVGEKAIQATLGDRTPIAPDPTASAPAPAAPTPAARPGISPQQALNEQAIAARRAAPAPVAAAQPPAEPIVPASGQMRLTAAELKEFTRLRTRGLSNADALDAVNRSRELAARLGGATDAEVAKAVATRR